MKKLSFLLGLLALTISSFAADVNETVLKVFSKTYPDAQSISWSLQSSGYLVYFTRKEVSYRVLYDQDGNVVLSIKNYAEEDLSPLVLNRIRKSYPDYTIHSVIEKSNDSSVEYHVILEGNKKLITLKSDPTGNLELVSKYDRG